MQQEYLDLLVDNYVNIKKYDDKAKELISDIALKYRDKYDFLNVSTENKCYSFHGSVGVVMFDCKVSQLLQYYLLNSLSTAIFRIPT